MQKKKNPKLKKKENLKKIKKFFFSIFQKHPPGGEKRNSVPPRIFPKRQQGFFFPERNFNIHPLVGHFQVSLNQEFYQSGVFGNFYQNKTKKIWGLKNKRFFFKENLTQITFFFFFQRGFKKKICFSQFCKHNFGAPVFLGFFF